MGYTLVGLVDQCAGELSLPQPSIIAGSGNNQSKQFQALTNRLLRDLVREYEWQRLVKANVFVGTDAVTTTGNTTDDSAIITSIPSTTNIAAGYIASGTGIRTFAEVLSVDSATQVTLNMPATVTGTTVSLTFKKQDFTLPTDYDRLVADTNWDRVNFWRMHGPKSSQEWQWIHSGLIAASVASRFRLYDNKFRITPAPSSSEEVFAYEYVSNYTVIASGGTSATKTASTADTDQFVFPDDLMLAGLKYYFLKAKKLDFAVEMAEYADILATRKAQDVPVSVQSLSPMPFDPLDVNTSEGNWDVD